MFKEKPEPPAYLIFYNHYRSFSPRRRRVGQLFRLLLVIIVAVGSLYWLLIAFASDAKPPLAAEIYLPPTATDSCASIPQDHLQSLRDANQLLIATFADGQPVTPDRTLVAPQAICILVVVPQKEPEIWYDVPTKGKGPDTIHLLLTSSDVVLTFPPLLPLSNSSANGTSSETTQFQNSVIYAAETILLHPGSYSISAEHEWADWKWAQEWSYIGEEEQFLYKSGYEAKTGLASVYWFESKIIESAMMFPPKITITGKDAAFSRPTCNATMTAANGRWYNATAFPGMKPELVDEWGFAWEGDNCRIDHYNQDDIFNCFEDKVVHVYGDSMLRRQVKNILYGGRWCLNPYDKCQTEDDRDEVSVTKLVHLQSGGIVEQYEEREHFRERGTAPITFGKNSTLYFTFSGSLVTGPHSWVPALFDEENIYSDGESWALDPAARARSPPEMLPADLVLFGIGAWDSALDETFDAFAEQLPQFRKALMQAYGGDGIDYDGDGVVDSDSSAATAKSPTSSTKPPVMAMRLGNSYCCRGTDLIYRRYTGTRVQHTDDLIREHFRVDPIHGATAMDGRIMVVDPRNMNGRWEVIRDFGGAPGNNHPRASHVRVETQMLLNSICERDPKTGRAKMRDAAQAKRREGYAEEERSGGGSLKQ